MKDKLLPLVEWVLWTLLCVFIAVAMLVMLGALAVISLVHEWYVGTIELFQAQWDDLRAILDGVPAEGEKKRADVE